MSNTNARNSNNSNNSNIDLNIDNYSFSDVLNLFQLKPDHGGVAITDRDLQRCRETVDKLHPSRSNLSMEYYDLFNRAYDILESKSLKSSKTVGGKSRHVSSSSSSSSYAPYTGEGTRDYLDTDVGAGADVMPYGFYSVAQSKPQLEARVAAREAGAAAAAQTTAAAAAARIAAVPPSSSLLGYYTPQPFSTRMVTIHTDDRDVLKYPLENVFEVVLPAVIKHAISVELFDISLPAFYYNLSTHLQNTKMWFSVTTYFTDPIELEVPSGRYTPDQLCAELALQLNRATTARLYSDGVFTSPTTQYTRFSVTHSAITRRVSFLNTEDDFVLRFDVRSGYAQDPGMPPFDSWKLVKHWGLGYNLGFGKLAVYSGLDRVVVSPTVADLEAPATIYMDIEPFNWIDEASPFLTVPAADASGSTPAAMHSSGDVSGRVNNSFAKLALSTVSNCYAPVKKFKRVLPQMVEKVGRLKFKFRYHSGMLVDFQQQGFDFSLKFECRFN